MYYLSGQINIRKDLIEKELNRGVFQSSDFKQLKLTKKFINWLFRHYTLHEFTIHFYDDEPEYEYDEENDTIPYFPMDWYKLWRDYENRRMTFNNWIDVFGPGIWDFTDKENEDIVRDCLISVRNWPVKKKDRVYWAKNEDSIWIYCYSRDFLGEDYWFIMTRK